MTGMDTGLALLHQQIAPAEHEGPLHSFQSFSQHLEAQHEQGKHTRYLSVCQFGTKITDLFKLCGHYFSVYPNILIE